VRKFSDIVRPAKRDVGALESARTLAENVARTVDQDVCDIRIVQQRLKRAEAEELGTHVVELGVGDRRSRGEAHPLAKERPSRGLRVRGEQPRRIDSDRDLGTDARNKRRIGHASARRSASTARRVGARAANASSAR